MGSPKIGKFKKDNLQRFIDEQLVPKVFEITEPIIVESDGVIDLSNIVIRPLNDTDIFHIRSRFVFIKYGWIDLSQVKSPTSKVFRYMYKDDLIMGGGVSNTVIMGDYNHTRNGQGYDVIYQDTNTSNPKGEYKNHGEMHFVKFDNVIAAYCNRMSTGDIENPHSNNSNTFLINSIGNKQMGDKFGGSAVVSGFHQSAHMFKEEPLPALLIKEDGILLDVYSHDVGKPKSKGFSAHQIAIDNRAKGTILTPRSKKNVAYGTVKTTHQFKKDNDIFIGDFYPLDQKNFISYLDDAFKGAYEYEILGENAEFKNPQMLFKYTFSKSRMAHIIYNEKFDKENGKISLKIKGFVVVEFKRLWLMMVDENKPNKIIIEIEGTSKTLSKTFELSEDDSLNKQLDTGTFNTNNTVSITIHFIGVQQLENVYFSRLFGKTKRIHKKFSGY